MDHRKEFKRYLQVEGRTASRTIGNYVDEVDKFLDFATASGRAFSGVLAEDYLKHLWAKGNKSNYRKFVRMSIRRFYRWLVLKSELDASVLDTIDPIKDDWVHLPVLEWEQVKQLMDACDGTAAERNRVMIRLLFESAMRVSELCNLNLDSLRRESTSIQIRTKGGGGRVVLATGDCFTAIQDYVRRWRTRHAVNTPALFVAEKRYKGQRIKRRMVSHVIRRLSKKLGLATSSSHTLRRSRATQLLDAGIPITEVQEFLGHDDIDATQRYTIKSSAKVMADYRKYFSPPTEGPLTA